MNAKKIVEQMLSARFELAIFRVSGERIDQLSHESELIQQLVDVSRIFCYFDQQKQCIISSCWPPTCCST
jgi:hypothetical protein